MTVWYAFAVKQIIDSLPFCYKEHRLRAVQEQDVADTKSYGSGLTNLGNTCYMNSCLQCLHAVPELVPALENPAPGQSQTALATQAASLFKDMSRGVTIQPMLFLLALRSAAPQFNQMSDTVIKGQRIHAQQDAEECWSAVRFWQGPLTLFPAVAFALRRAWACRHLHVHQRGTSCLCRFDSMQHWVSRACVGCIAECAVVSNSWPQFGLNAIIHADDGIVERCHQAGRPRSDPRALRDQVSDHAEVQRV